MTGNGKVYPFVGKPPADVLIVGQPFTMKAWFLSLLVTCNCSDRPEPVLIVGQSGATSGPCPLCGRHFVLQAVSASA